MLKDLSTFPVTKRWPAQFPERIQLYSLPTPNGVKVSIMLEETGLPYEPHLVNFGSNDQPRQNSPPRPLEVSSGYSLSNRRCRPVEAGWRRQKRRIESSLNRS